MLIEVDTHTHTVASGHAYSTVGEIAAAAAARGLRLLAFTDHGPAMPGAPHPWHFMNMRVIPRSLCGVGILRSVEANIISQRGELDIDDRLIDRLDMVLASLHEPVFPPQKMVANTDALLGTMASGKVDIIGHPGNPAFPIDIEEVAKAAASHDVLIEINNSSFISSRPGSKDNCERIAQAVIRHGGRLAFGSDAHIAQAAGDLGACVALTNRLAIPVESVLTAKANDFLGWLAQRGRLAPDGYRELLAITAATGSSSS